MTTCTNDKGHCWHWGGRVEASGIALTRSYNLDICCFCGEQNKIYDPEKDLNFNSSKVYQEPEHGKFKPVGPTARW